MHVGFREHDKSLLAHVKVTSSSLTMSRRAGRTDIP
jgi:hypothetical protein